MNLFQLQYKYIGYMALLAIAECSSLSTYTIKNDFTLGKFLQQFLICNALQPLKQSG